MLTALAAFVLAVADTTIVLGEVERDLTADGKPEVLRLVGTGRNTDSLDVTFIIQSGTDTIYRARLAPLTRTIGHDAGRRIASSAEHHRRLAEFGEWFFDAKKFVSPTGFVDELRAMAAERIAEIPDVIERDRPRSESRRGAEIWKEISGSAVEVFTFSPGGDVLFAIGWSSSARRFYRLLECC